MNWVHLIALLALFQYLYFGFQVGMARKQYGVKAPATTGHEGFERAYRVQMNTLEQLVVFVPALLLAGQYWSQPWVAGIGAVYLLGRFIYGAAYRRDPARRATGFLLTLAASALLLLLALLGALRGLPAPI